MRKYPIGLVVVALLTIGVASAVAQTASPTVVDLGNGKITGPISFEATETSDVVMDRYVYDAAGKGHTWHSHPPNVNIIMKGSVTVHTASETGCTAKTYIAGQAYYDPGVTHVSEASKDLELVATLVGVPVGGALSKPENTPTGPNCPAQVNPGFARTELSRSTIQGASKASATGDSDVLMQFVTVPPKTNFRDSWYSSPAALLASVKSGSLTIFRSGATGCTSQTSTAGQGAFVPANEVIFVRNEGSTPAEVYATRVGLPVGAAPRVDAANPGGANCPDVAAAATPAPSSDLPVTGGAAGTLVMLGLGLTGMGTVARAFGRRR